MTPLYQPQSMDTPAQALIKTLLREQAQLEADMPKDSRIVATAILTTGENIKIISAYATGPDLIAFTGIRDKKTMKIITRYEMIAQVVFYFEKGQPQSIDFSLEPHPMGFRPDRPQS